jgi:hypothetical protein
MNSKLRRTSAVVVVLILVLAGALLQSFWGNAAAQSNSEGTLQGTWRVQINPINCQTGAPLPIPSFSALDSYARGGTLTEVVNAAAFLPGQVTPGIGVWSHTQADAYKAVWEVFILFDTPPTVPGFPFKRGVQRLMRDIEVHGDQMTFNAMSQFLDPDGNPFIPARNTCASGTGTRFEDVSGED